MHHHPAPEKLGTVSFPVSCQPAVQADFNRAVALLHSFAYEAADKAFGQVVQADPQCAMAHWGRAMTHYHQLWDVPPSPADMAAGRQEITQAAGLQASERERGYVQALGNIFETGQAPYSERALRYEAGLRQMAQAHPGDTETQVFYALSLVSNAPPTDKEHRRQKQAADILQPLFQRSPDHPGIAHYLIHACDNMELASRGLPAARLYAGIAPSAPHALHMPSHIFTRLGLWDDSVTSNLAARDAARAQGDVGEELHAMDYLVYAYLQAGRDADAAQVLGQLKSMPLAGMGSFKVGYAATAMPVRFLVERGRWAEAQAVADPPPSALPHVTAITVWARGMGYARQGKPAEAEQHARHLVELEDRLRASGNTYWAAQVNIMRREVEAWSAQAAGRPRDAAAILRKAADDEDAVEKLPVTPGPIVPAREQLAQMLQAQGDLAGALQAFQAAQAQAPGRRGTLAGMAQLSQAQGGQHAHASAAATAPLPR